jgi:hypothetical protein
MRGSPPALAEPEQHGMPVDSIATCSVLRDTTNSCKRVERGQSWQVEGSQHAKATLRDSVVDLAQFPCTRRQSGALIYALMATPKASCCLQVNWNQY